jgi:hypothetical protein
MVLKWFEHKVTMKMAMNCLLIPHGLTGCLREGLRTMGQLTILNKLGERRPIE